MLSCKVCPKYFGFIAGTALRHRLRRAATAACTRPAFWGQGVYRFFCQRLLWSGLFARIY